MDADTSNDDLWPESDAAFALDMAEREEAEELCGQCGIRPAMEGFDLCYGCYQQMRIDWDQNEAEEAMRSRM